MKRELDKKIPSYIMKINSRQRCGLLIENPASGGATSSRISGFMLLETLIAVVIFAIFVMFFVASFNNIFASQASTWERQEASLYAQEGLEVAYNIFANTANWYSLTGALDENTAYKLKVDAPPAFLKGTELLSAEYTREISFERVYRSNSTHEIVNKTIDPSAQLDSDTILVKSTITWVGKGGSDETEFLTYFVKPPSLETQ